jgi:hypothetical protein
MSVDSSLYKTRPCCPHRGQCSLENEQPLPAGKPCTPGEEGYRRGEQTPKRSRYRHRGGGDSHPRRSLFRLVPKKRCIMIPGKKPASARPRKMRHARSPPDVLTATVQTVTMPQETLIREIHWLEEKYYRRTLEQNSLRTYGTKKRATATL